MEVPLFMGWLSNYIDARLPEQCWTSGILDSVIPKLIICAIAYGMATGEESRSLR
jgi:hypothetical protein